MMKGSDASTCLTASIAAQMDNALSPDYHPQPCRGCAELWAVVAEADDELIALEMCLAGELADGKSNFTSVVRESVNAIKRILSRSTTGEVIAVVDGETTTFNDNGDREAIVIDKYFDQMPSEFIVRVRRRSHG